jgi:hypothetical protein
MIKTCTNMKNCTKHKHIVDHKLSNCTLGNLWKCKKLLVQGNILTRWRTIFLMKLRMHKFKNVVFLLIQNFKDRKILLVHTFEEIMSFWGKDYVIQRNKCPKGQNSRTSEFQKGGVRTPGHPHLESEAPVFGSANVYA